MKKKNKVVVIAGPTAVGKSEAGIKLAQWYGGEIISGDSMQIYKGLDIGTAKVSPSEQQLIPHHLIDKKSPSESYSAAEFQEDADRLIDHLNDKNKLPIVVGGTGFYLRGLTRKLDFHNANVDELYRRNLETFAAEHGSEALHEKLKQVDPESAESIHYNNVKKIIRALEIYHVTGKKKKDFSFQEDNDSPYHLVLIGMTMERDLLYERINKRVDQMVEEGVIEEARWLYQNFPKDCQAAQAIGYKEFFPYFKGEYNKEAAIEILKRNSRRYAKRQLTWFRNKENMTWFHITEKNKNEKIQEMIRFTAGELQ
ncbi:tRNA (adenosine(37)-N6)-dimethylallyltransferase MiaA [Alteribacillus iranensis]|uniref:tRNA dimethylallyltransferase n=1 Tax=Alteribacillus iranensis TaxID=930128 RepID=A0A1I2A452_9BACI|nr:tRNA (adenosine(37)-N6)-dimethylallyltransferase MiaA [Alteribacillus iranensis]SFE37520.1 tRNA dimethylallyltransferase [Alteribacillus iranensis]